MIKLKIIMYLMIIILFLIMSYSMYQNYKLNNENKIMKKTFEKIYDTALDYEIPDFENRAITQKEVQIMYIRFLSYKYAENKTQAESKDSVD